MRPARAGGGIRLAAFRRADPPAGIGGGGGPGAGYPDSGRTHRPAGPRPRRPHLRRAAGTERKMGQDHPGHRAPYRVYCRLLQTRAAAQRGPRPLDAAHPPGPGPGGGTAAKQHLPAPGDPGGLRPAAAGTAGPGAGTAHHGGGRQSGLCPAGAHPHCPGKPAPPPARPRSRRPARGNGFLPQRQGGTPGGL